MKICFVTWAYVGPHNWWENLKGMEQNFVFVNIEPILVQINVQMMESMAIIEALKEVNLNYIELKIS